MTKEQKLARVFAVGQALLGGCLGALIAILLAVFSGVGANTGAAKLLILSGFLLGCFVVHRLVLWIET
jgi:hypothetical protein